LANCIEKTAEFICVQGAQMEILMRAKETENPKFQFLNPGNPYHQIYKQVLEKKRSRPKNYNPAAASAAVAAEAARVSSLEVEKSLQILIHNMKTAAPDVGSNPSSSSSSSSPTNAYSKLVERIRDHQLPLQRQTPSPKTATPPPPQTTTTPHTETPTPPPDENLVTVNPPPITMQGRNYQNLSHPEVRIGKYYRSRTIRVQGS
jgi:hypothetical protein